MKEKIAGLISFLFDPSLTVPLFFVVLIANTGLTNNQLAIILPIIFMVNVVLPASIFFLFLRQRLITDWEMTKRQERVSLYLIFSLLLLTGSLIIYFLGNSLLFKFHLIFSLTFLAGTLVTIFWKVSIHMLADTMVVIFLNFLFPGFWWFYLLLLPVAWSRYVRHKHTPAQLLAGFLLASTVVFIGFRFG